MRFKSVTGQVMEIFEDRIELSQEGVLGFLTQGLQGTKTYYFKDISSVQFKNCGWTNGFFEFTMPGGNDKQGGAWGGITNDNRFTFGAPTIGRAREVAEEAEKVYAFIQNRLRAAKTKSDKSANIQQISSADELKKFKELLDSGIITQEEFDAKKKQILGL